jgi:hypothetical protein
MRDYLGHTLISMRDNIAYEAALGDHGRSASSSISGRRSTRRRARTAIRKPIFDKQTGAIDHKTAAYWHEHYDLDAILQRDWTRWARSCRASCTSTSAPTTPTS